tara:strand:+ start:609 stop:1142 length:534 start_codon:yes stop_codon:yes gene_type:complete
MSGRIEVILGCMFSGKSTELLRRLRRWKAVGFNVLTINHSLDVRTNNSVKTHDNVRSDALKISSLLSIVDSDVFKTNQIIGIDEAHFFEDLLEFVLVSEKAGKTIIVAGLDGDYRREPIGDILKLIPLCDEVVKLQALDMIDRDGSPAIFSKRIVSGNSQILVGAQESYKAVSRKNY